MDGVLIVDKKKGKTSFDVIRDIRKKYDMKKVGHTGTLDPLTTGVLPILLGEATKLSDYLMNHDKEYIAVLKLGKKTETGDSEGKIIVEKTVPNVDINNIDKVMQSFVGEIHQIPPMYSAIKVDGKKLYELARKGQEVERKPRKIKIYSIKDINFDKQNKEIEFIVNCSKGTYIRTLCEDIAEKLGSVGFMKSLRRTRVGQFTLEDIDKIVSIEDILKKEQEYRLKNYEVKRLVNGVKIETNLQNGLVRIYNNNEFIGVGEVYNKELKRKILINFSK